MTDDDYVVKMIKILKDRTESNDRRIAELSTSPDPRGPRKADELQSENAHLNIKIHKLEALLREEEKEKKNEIRV